MKTITIKANELKAVAMFAADSDVRYYLNGVLVEANATTTRLAATNGHYLGLFDTRAENTDVDYVETIVPIHVVEQIVKSSNRSSYGDVTLTIDDGKFALNYSGLSVAFAPVDGKFPDYKRVIPDKVSGEAAHFASETLVMLTKVQKIFDKKLPPRIWHSGEGSALVQLHGADNFIGVLMPYQLDDMRGPKPSAPSTLWARAPLAVAQAEAA